MNKETHYLHVSYMMITGDGVVNYGDILVENKGTIKDLREYIREEISKNRSCNVVKYPIILSMTELSESLYKTLMGE